MGRLELRWDDFGPRNYLNGEPLSAGTILEVALDDGAWTLARYEYTWDRETQTFDAYLLIPHPDTPHKSSYLEADSALCRWPPSD